MEKNNYKFLSELTAEKIENDKKNGYENSFAFKNENAVRKYPDKDKATLIRSPFIRDTEKIMHLPFYNRYADKTQVFSFYKNDDITRRILHVQIVSRIARTIGNVLGLNLDLIEAIALGHDIGHTPFGHAGEKFLSTIYHDKTNRYFNHNVHSVRVLSDIFNRNITLQTLDGILCHNGEIEFQRYAPCKMNDFATLEKKYHNCYIDQNEIKRLIPCTLEGCLVRICDIIAYVGKDRQDAERAKLPIYEKYKNYSIGSNNAEIINNVTVDIIENSYNKDCIILSDNVFKELSEIKKENYALIYNNEKTNGDYKIIEKYFNNLYERLLFDLENGVKSSPIFTHHINYINENHTVYLPKDYNDIVCDYIASMTDDYFIELYEYLFPKEKCKIAFKGYFDKD